MAEWREGVGNWPKGRKAEYGRDLSWYVVTVGLVRKPNEPDSSYLPRLLAFLFGQDWRSLINFIAVEEYLKMEEVWKNGEDTTLVQGS